MEYNYHDLICLPKGGHIPPQILEKLYGVARSVIAAIPRRGERDENTFRCPICGRGSYFTGVCDSCATEGYYSSLFAELNGEKEAPITLKIAAYHQASDARKRFEHTEILRLVEKGGWETCHYMRA